MKKSNIFNTKLSDTKTISGFTNHALKWLRRNRGKFKYKPIISFNKHKKILYVRFANISCLEMVINDYGGCSLCVKHRREDGHMLFDILGDFDTCLKKTKKGLFYCDLYLDKKYYWQKEKVWNESLKELLEWCTKYLKAENCIYFVISEEWTFAQIGNCENAKIAISQCRGKGLEVLEFPLEKAPTAKSGLSETEGSLNAMLPKQELYIFEKRVNAYEALFNNLRRLD